MDETERQDGLQPADVERFLHLVTAHNRSIYAYIFSLVPDYFDADDIMQETVTFLFRRFNEYEPGTNFLAWALQVARLRVLSFFQAKKNRRLLFDQGLVDRIEADAVTMVGQINHRLEALRYCRKKLCASEDRLLKMRYEQELPVRRIGEELGRSVQSIYRALARIHEMLLRCVRLRMAEIEA